MKDSSVLKIDYFSDAPGLSSYPALKIAARNEIQTPRISNNFIWSASSIVFCT